MPLETAVGAVIPHYFRETRIRVVEGKNTTIIVRNFFPPRDSLIAIFIFSMFLSRG